jgi:hypothetical protein
MLIDLTIQELLILQSLVLGDREGGTENTRTSNRMPRRSKEDLAVKIHAAIERAKTASGESIN